MRYPASEKLEIIRLVEQSRLSARRTLQKLGIPRSTFNRWYDRFLTGGIDALVDQRPRPNRVWNRIPEETRDQIIELALNEPELSPPELAVTFTDTKGDKTTAPNQLWQTDFTYFKITGWGWYYLSTVLDDFSRFIIAWRLCTTMSARDVSDTLDDALRFTRLDQVKVKHKPRLLSDNGPSYISSELAHYLEDQNMTHTRGKPYHPQTQGKIERWHRSLKNQILLENYYFPDELQDRIRQFVDYYNHERYHESLNNLTPADVFNARGQSILDERKKIKHQTLAMRRRMYYDNHAKFSNMMS